MPVVTAQISNTFLSPYYLKSHSLTLTHSAVSTLPYIPLKWVEPMVTQAYSRRGNHTLYIMGVTPYIPGADGAKNSLVGACELFCN